VKPAGLYRPEGYYTRHWRLRERRARTKDIGKPLGWPGSRPRRGRTRRKSDWYIGNPPSLRSDRHFQPCRKLL